MKRVRCEQHGEQYVVPGYGSPYCEACPVVDWQTDLIKAFDASPEYVEPLTFDTKTNTWSGQR